MLIVEIQDNSIMNTEQGKSVKIFFQVTHEQLLVSNKLQFKIKDTIDTILYRYQCDSNFNGHNPPMLPLRVSSSDKNLG